jgi:hypothetical protein
MTTPQNSSGELRGTPQEKARAKRLQKLYRITTDQYDQMFRAQKGKCKICGRPPKRVRLNVDHDHRQEKEAQRMVIRGLLCGMCNRKILGVIERLKVDPQKIVDYIRSKPVFIDGKET